MGGIVEPGNHGYKEEMTCKVWEWCLDKDWENLEYGEAGVPDSFEDI